MQTFYRVDIQRAEGSAPANGFIDDRKIESYMRDGSVPTTLAQSEAKERANMRFETLIAKLQMFANIYVREVQATGANAIAAPSTFSFVAEVERGDSALVTQDEVNPGAYLTGASAIKRAVARALVVGKVDFGETYDPTPSTGFNNGNNVPRYGQRITRIEFGPVANNLTAAEQLVTVTSITR